MTVSIASIKKKSISRYSKELAISPDRDLEGCIGGNPRENEWNFDPRRISIDTYFHTPSKFLFTNCSKTKAKFNLLRLMNWTRKILVFYFPSNREKKKLTVALNTKILRQTIFRKPAAFPGREKKKKGNLTFYLLISYSSAEKLRFPIHQPRKKKEHKLGKICRIA